jgi:hypothetical protein
MTPRQRLQATLDHRQPDRVCVDLGATPVTGMHASTVSKLRRALLGEPDFRVKVVEPFQMLGEIDPPLLDALGADVLGVGGRNNMFGFRNEGWKPFELYDGTPVLVPEKFNTEFEPDGSLRLYPQGDRSVPPSGRMPAGGFYFDAIGRQEPIDEDALDPADNLEEFAPLADAELAHFAARAERLSTQTDRGIMLMVPGAAFGDIALVPGPSLKRPRGIRDVAEWYISTIARKDLVREIFERECEIALANIDRLAGVVGDRADAAFVSGTDFGTQRGLFLSVESYRELFKPYHQRVCDRIHERTRWKTFIHTCGSITPLIEEFIDAGFDILNPVQCSAADMDPAKLKRRFGGRIVFWGGGVDTQRTLPFGTAEQVYQQVADRVRIFNAGGGFVFNAIHNIQANTPVANLLAMFEAIRDGAARA